MQKATLFFCVFTTALLLALAFVMNQIGHTPWGLIGAAILAFALTAQQMLRKPRTNSSVSNSLKSLRGVA